jgi:hypothetical protein
MEWVMKHKLVVLGIIVVVVGAIFWGMTQNSAPEPVLSPEVTTTGSPTADTVDRELVATLLALRTVNLSGTIFADPAFTSLKDFGTTIVPEPVGRPNPFAPLNQTGAVPASSGAGAGANLFNARR